MSDPGRRADPTAELRRRLDELERATERLRAENEAQRRSTPEAARILLAEDQEEVSNFTRVLLTNAGHEVDVVENGAEAVSAAARADYDLILMDVQMPVMGGLEATRRIRDAESGRRRTPIVALSGATGAEERRTFADAGVDDQLAKPFRRAALFKKVDEWLQKPASSEAVGEEVAETGIDDLRGMMGDEWVDRGLARLQTQLDELFAGGVEDAAAAGRRAHALIGVAALLGFTRLSRLCATLEEACKGGGDVRAAFEASQAAAEAARRQAAAALKRAADRRT